MGWRGVTLVCTLQVFSIVYNTTVSSIFETGRPLL
eukprot:SAG22_NODE_17205_length_309_cov_1.409524_1_plen_34_part_10